MTEFLSRLVVICPEKDDICEICGKLEELRPYGKRKTNGIRTRLCYDCMLKDEEEAKTAFFELMDAAANPQ